MRLSLTLAVLAALLLLGACAQGRKSTTQAAAPPDQAKPVSQAWGNAPDFSFTGFDGSSGRLSDYQGTPLVLNFWADWCPPCKLEMPMFEEAYQAHAGKFELLGVATSSSENPQAFVAQNGYSWTFAHDTNGQQLYRVDALPTTVFIDRQGNVAHRFTGAFPDHAAFLQALSSIL